MWKYVVVQTHDRAMLVFLLLCLCWSHSVSLPLMFFRPVSNILEQTGMLILRLKPQQKRTAAVTTEAHIVSDDNTEPVLYMTTAHCTKHHNHRGPAHRHINSQSDARKTNCFNLLLQMFPDFLCFGFIWLSEFSSRMFGRTLLLVCVTIFFCAGKTGSVQISLDQVNVNRLYLYNVFLVFWTLKALLIRRVTN